jgi:hypothetical protein
MFCIQNRGIMRTYTDLMRASHTMVRAIFRIEIFFKYCRIIILSYWLPINQKLINVLKEERVK